MIRLCTHAKQTKEGLKWSLANGSNFSFGLVDISEINGILILLAYVYLHFSIRFNRKVGTFLSKLSRFQKGFREHRYMLLSFQYFFHLPFNWGRNNLLLCHVFSQLAHIQNFKYCALIKSTSESCTIVIYSLLRNLGIIGSSQKLFLLQMFSSQTDLCT